MHKRRILFNTEFSATSSGFGTYTKNVLTRLHATNKYEIAEFASFGTLSHPEVKNIPWRYYANAVDPGDPRHAQYKQHPSFSFGQWRFNRVLLDFKPDVVFNIRDPWMLMYEADSPYRRFFYQAIMPTVDSAPQQEEWIENFLQADAVLTYTDWAQHVLYDQSGGQMKLCGIAPPCVDLQTFSPRDNKPIRKQLGLPDNANIIGTVMRNQKRKLYPDLFVAFRRFLELCHKNNNNELADNTYLYCHTSYPDFGWNLPLLLKEQGISHKVYFTYICKHCNKHFATLFHDARTSCPFCRNASAVMPSVSHGLSYEDMGNMMSCFDLYIQYAICLGKNEPILTKRGWVPISQIELGDYVWTHKHRWRKIINRWKNLPKSHNKKMLKVSTFSDYATVLATENHEFYSLTLSDFNSTSTKTTRELLGDWMRLNKTIPDPTPKPLTDLTSGDMIAYPIDTTIKDIQSIDISQYCGNKDTITDNHIQCGTHKYKYRRFIDINDVFCKLIGIYTADGSARFKNKCGYIRISNHSDDIKQQKCVTEGFEQLKSDKSTIGYRKYPTSNCIDISLCSSIYAKMFIDWCNKKGGKKLPDWTMHLPLEKQKMILSGLFMADGCYYNNNNRNLTCYTTISTTLAEQVKHILRRLHINFGCYIIDKNKNSKDGFKRHQQYRFEIRGDLSNQEFDTKRQSTNNIYHKNLHLMKIKHIKDVDYNDDVWNIEVEDDNTYTTKIGVSKNCEGFGMPQVEALGIGVPVAAINYSGMVDIIKKSHGIPIKVERFFRELETGSYRAYPDNKYAAEQMYKFLTLPDDVRKQKSRQARQGAEQHYDWDKTAKKWEEIFDNANMTGDKGRWHAPIKIKRPAQLTPETNKMDNMTFINWLITKVLCEPEKLHSFMSMRMLRDLNYGAEIQGQHPSPISRETLYQRCIAKTNEYNIFEELRCGIRSAPTEDYLIFANKNNNKDENKDEDKNG